MDNDEKIKRANEASRLLKSELLTEFFETYRATVYHKMATAKTDEGTIRGKLLVGVLDDFRMHLENLLKHGQYAANEIKLEDERKKRRWPFAA